MGWYWNRVSQSHFVHGIEDTVLASTTCWRVGVSSDFQLRIQGSVVAVGKFDGGGASQGCVHRATCHFVRALPKYLSTLCASACAFVGTQKLRMARWFHPSLHKLQLTMPYRR